MIPIAKPYNLKPEACKTLVEKVCPRRGHAGLSVAQKTVREHSTFGYDFPVAPCLAEEWGAKLPQLSYSSTTP